MNIQQEEEIEQDNLEETGDSPKNAYLLKIENLAKRLQRAEIHAIVSKGDSTFSSSAMTNPFGSSSIISTTASFSNDAMRISESLDSKKSAQSTQPTDWLSLLKTQFPIWQTRYKQLLSELRKEAASLGANGSIAVSHILAVQQKLTVGFQKILQAMLKEAQSLMGDAPCQYGWFGVGSYSRGEVLPYSDVECLWLFEEEKIETRRYFYFLNELINLQIESVGEIETGGFHPDQYPEVKEIVLANGKKEWVFKTLDEIAKDFATDCKAPEGVYTQIVSRLQGKLIVGEPYFWKRYVEFIQQKLQEKNTAEFSPFSGVCRKILYVSVADFEKTWLKPNLSDKNPQEDVKQGYAFFLTYLAVLLKYYYGVESESSVEIFESLKYKKILSPTLTQSLIDAWKEMQALRYRTQMYYQGGVHKIKYPLPVLTTTSSASPNIHSNAPRTTAVVSTDESENQIYILNEKEEHSLTHILENVLKPIYVHLAAIKIIDNHIKSKTARQKNTSNTSSEEIFTNSSKDDFWFLLNKHQADYLKVTPALILPGSSKESFQRALSQVLRTPRPNLIKTVTLLTNLGARGDNVDTLQLTPMRQVLVWSETKPALAKSIWQCLIHAQGETEEKQEIYPETLLEQAMKENKVRSVIVLCELGAGRCALVETLLPFIETLLSHFGRKTPRFQRVVSTKSST